MTNEQHIENLKKLKSFHNGSYGSDIDRAIRAIEQEPCDDVISRQAVDDYIVKLLDGYLYDEERTRLEGLCAYLWELPSVTQKSGKWQVVSDGYGDSAYICECSECKDTVWVYKNADRKWKYCPNCGAKMESEE